MHDLSTMKRLNRQREVELRKQRLKLRVIDGDVTLQPSSTVPGKVEVVDGRGRVVGHQG